MSDPTTSPAPWCDIVGVNGVTVRTDSFASHPEGSQTVTVLNPDGGQAGTWVALQWGDADQAADAMSDLWRAVTGGESVTDPEFGVELAWDLPGGCVRICPDGTYVRVLDDFGFEVRGSAYWSVTEWVEDAPLAMGAILGAASSVAD